MHFLTLCDAMWRRYPEAHGKVTIPYLPYARQDRMCSKGQHFGLHVMSQLLSTIPQKTITTYDLHSKVASSLLAEDGFGVIDIQQYDILMKHSLGEDLADGRLRLVSPDKGAKDKTAQVSSFCNSKMSTIVGGKTRDPKTGKITEFTVDEDDLCGQDLLIVDDICDGGGTFIGLADELKKRGAGEISLFVTHGIFSRGFDGFSGLIDHIYTTDSFRRSSDLPFNGVVAENVTLTTIKV